MKKAKIIILCIIVHVGGMYAQMEHRSGLLLGGGRISSTHDEQVKFDVIRDKADVNPLFDAEAGYRLRLQPKDRKFFVDLDLLAGLRMIKTAYYQNWFDPETPLIRGHRTSQITHGYIRFSFNPTFNYNFFDGWYAGVGVEPTFYTASPGSISGSGGKEEGIDRHRKFSGFDVPLTARLGYDFKYMDVAFGYKYGLRNVLAPVYFDSGKVNAWQLQVFIPF
jgi:hypothetical protein